MDQDARKSLTLTQTDFSSLEVQERQDLEEWIKDNPDILGAEFLLITSEFDRFDKSDKRLDLLAIDRDKKLVIIELKRDVKGTLADLQAIRYAAFCSVITLEYVINLYAEFRKMGVEEARQKIQEFVGDPTFSKLDNKPRIVLAAGSFDDPEVTSCVLWLRNFGVDISCVEISPYRMPDNRIVLVPKVLIPLPEAKDYIVGVERKEADEARQPRFTEHDLLEMASARGVSSIVEICRRLKAIWPAEFPGPGYGGSIAYWVQQQNFTRSVFGMNISGKRSKDTPSGEMDVWVRPKNLADAAGLNETVIRDRLTEDHQAIEQGKDCVIRLRTPSQAERLVLQLKEWASGASGAPGV